MLHGKGLKSLQGIVSFNVPMRRYTTIRTGGAAAALFQPESIEALADCLRLCKERRVSLLAIGAGSNIIVKDKGIDGLVIKLSSPFFRGVEACGTEIASGAGASLSKLSYIAERNSLGGLEFLAGIPGTVGGAIIQNAGAQGKSISGIIRDVKCIDRNGRLRTFKNRQIGFGYRESGLEKFIILGVTFKLRKRERNSIRKDTSSYIERRLLTQDYTSPSAGCIFKNPKARNLSAGELIERCGLKSKRIGDASVSGRHANFIVNRGHAQTKDILYLIALIKKRVRKNFGISLEEEVKIIG